MMALSETDSFVEALRFQSQRYHDRHHSHLKMNYGRPSRRQIQGWVANRYAYQGNFPRKDAAILAHCLSPNHRIVAEAMQAADQLARQREAVPIFRPHPGRP